MSQIAQEGPKQVARIVIRLSRQAKRRLSRLQRGTRDAAYRTRLLIVLHYAGGSGSKTIAAALGIAPATAVRVAHRYLEQGELGLVDGRSGNGCAKVDQDLLQALAELVNESPKSYRISRPTWTRESLTKALTKKTGVRVSVSTIARMLNTLGARWGRAKPVVQCPWSKRSKDSKIREIHKLIDELPPSEVAYYEDEVDIHLNPKIGTDWMLPGLRKIVITPGKNKKRYVGGALSSDGTNLVYATSKRKNTDLFIALLDALRRRHPRVRRIHVIVDNYIIHSSQRLLRYLRDKDHFAIHFLPPYCPEHNPVERLWLELHANVTRNHSCRSIDGLMTQVRNFLRREVRRRIARRNTRAARRAA
jgi:transposase